MNYLEEATKEAKQGIKNEEGGPFGAIILKENKIVWKRRKRYE